MSYILQRGGGGDDRQTDTQHTHTHTQTERQTDRQEDWVIQCMYSMLYFSTTSDLPLNNFFWEFNQMYTSGNNLKCLICIQSSNSLS